MLLCFTLVGCLGAAGNRLAVTEASGRTVSYTYDALFRLTRETITSDGQTNGEVGYSYDAVGNRLSRTSTLPSVTASTSSYDANDRLESDTYDAAGNTVNANGNAYSYDAENRLTSINNGAVRYVYDGDGNRVAKTVGGITTTYLVDANNPTGYAQVVDELQGGVVTRSYAYGHDLISQRQLINNEWLTSFYGYDGHGSVRYLTNSEGSVTDTYTYDAFGTLISRTGSTPNDYLYAGERFDAETGLYHLRARYMNPASGRFWSMDSFEGVQHDPLTLHKYLYAGADPANKADPSGNFFSIAEAGAANSIASTLANIQSNIGFAIMDQIRFGGDAGIKNLLIGTGVIVGGAIAVRAIGGLLRRVALPPARSTSLIANALEPHELAQAQEILSFRGGEFVGPPTRSFPGIDGWLDGVPASLKEYSGSRPIGVLTHASDAVRQVSNAGYAGVELFISARGVRAKELLEFAHRGHLVQIPNQGVISSINIHTADGWVRIISGGL